MKEEIYKILDWNLVGTYETKQKCAEEILRLFSVVGQSQQLKCFIAEEFAQCHNPKKNSECISCKHY